MRAGARAYCWALVWVTVWCSSCSRGSDTAPVAKGSSVMSDDSTTSSVSLRLEELAALEQGYGARLAMHGDGQRWVSATQRAVHLWRDRTLEGTVQAAEPILDVRFASDGRTLLACPRAYDLEGGAWTAASIPAEALVAGLAAAPADRFALVSCAVAADGGDVVVGARYMPGRGLDGVDDYGGPGERVLLLRGAERALAAVLYEGNEERRALAMGEGFVAAAGRDIQVWERATGADVATLERHPVVVRALAFRADGKQLAAAGADGLLSLWDSGSWELLHAWAGHQKDVDALAWHPRLPVLVTGSRDGWLRVWSAEEPGRLLAEEQLGGWIEGLAMDPAGERLVVAVRGFPARLVLYRMGE